MEKAGNADIFRQYDVLRRGKITYEDFHNIVVSCNTGFTRTETDALAHELDKNRTGLIKYNQIVESLKSLDAQMAVENKLLKAPTPSRVIKDRDAHLQISDHKRVPYVPRSNVDYPPSKEEKQTVENSELPVLPSEIVRVESLAPSYPLSPMKTKTAAKTTENIDSERMLLGSYNPKYFGSSMNAIFNHDLNRRERARSAPPVRIQGPSTAEGTIAKEYSRRNRSTQHVIQKGDYGNKRESMNKRKAKANEDSKEQSQKNLSNRSLFRFLKTDNDEKAKNGSSRMSHENFDPKVYFSATERKKREEEKRLLRDEEIADFENRASKVRVNSIISQTQGNLKPLEVNTN